MLHKEREVIAMHSCRISAQHYQKLARDWGVKDFRFLSRTFPERRHRYFVLWDSAGPQLCGVSAASENTLVLAGISQRGAQDLSAALCRYGLNRARRCGIHWLVLEPEMNISIPVTVKSQPTQDTRILLEELEDLWCFEENQSHLWKKSGYCREAACRIECGSEANPDRIADVRVEWTADLERLRQKLDARILTLPEKEIEGRNRLIAQAHLLDRERNRHGSRLTLGQAVLVVRNGEGRVLKLHSLPMLHQSLLADLDERLQRKGIQRIHQTPQSLTVLEVPRFNLNNIFR